MRADLVVVFHVRQQYVTEMPLAEHNNMVKALPSDRTDETLSKSVLPWGPWRRRQACRCLIERRFLGGEAEPGRAISARLTVIARRTVTCCHTTNAGSC